MSDKPQRYKRRPCFVHACKFGKTFKGYLPYYTFPSQTKKPKQYKAWVAACKNASTPTHRSVVCAIHFKPSSFLHSHLDQAAPSRRILKYGAIPELNLPDIKSEYEQTDSELEDTEITSSRNVAHTECFVRDCTNKLDSAAKNKGITFHKFPPDCKSAIFKTWQTFCLQDTTPSKYHVLCSDHFSSANFFKNRELKHGSVPTLKVPAPFIELEYLPRVQDEQQPVTYDPTIDTNDEGIIVHQIHKDMETKPRGFNARELDIFPQHSSTRKFDTTSKCLLRGLLDIQLQPVVKLQRLPQHVVEKHMKHITKVEHKMVSETTKQQADVEDKQISETDQQQSRLKQLTVDKALLSLIKQSYKLQPSSQHEVHFRVQLEKCPTKNSKETTTIGDETATAAKEQSDAIDCIISVKPSDKVGVPRIEIRPAQSLPHSSLQHTTGESNSCEVLRGMQVCRDQLAPGVGDSSSVKTSSSTKPSNKEPEQDGETLQHNTHGDDAATCANITDKTSSSSNYYFQTHIKDKGNLKRTVLKRQEGTLSQLLQQATESEAESWQQNRCDVLENSERPKIALSSLSLGRRWKKKRKHGKDKRPDHEYAHRQKVCCYEDPGYALKSLDKAVTRVKSLQEINDELKRELGNLKQTISRQDKSLTALVDKVQPLRQEVYEMQERWNATKDIPIDLFRKDGLYTEEQRHFAARIYRESPRAYRYLAQYIQLPQKNAVKRFIREKYGLEVDPTPSVKVETSDHFADDDAADSNMQQILCDGELDHSHYDLVYEEAEDVLAPSSMYGY